MSERLVRWAKARLGEDQTARERGTVIVLFSLVLTILMGMAALTVDVGWLYYTGARAQRAADAAALAGVVHLPSLAPIVGGHPAHDIAIDIAARNGFANGVDSAVVTPASVPGSRFRFQVTIQYDAPTFFLKVFGIDPQQITRTALAEHLPAIRLGGRGNDIGVQSSDGYWIAVNGDITSAEQGDHLATQCSNSAADVSTSGCNFSNSHHQDPAYYYGVELATAGLDVDIYDAPGFDYDPTYAGNEHFDINWTPTTSAHKTTYTLYPPDNSPNDPTDNRNQPAICSVTFDHASSATINDPFGLGTIDKATYESTYRGQWTDFCDDPSAPPGQYVMEIIVSAGNTSNTFSMRETTPSSRVFAIEWISVHGSNDGSKFDLAEVPPEYVNRKITVSLYDPGETDGDSFVTITQEGTPRDCQYRVLDLFGNEVEGWQPDDDAGPNCTIQTSDATNSGCAPGSGDPTDCVMYNGLFLEVLFDLTGYSCTIGVDCYWVVDYDYAGPTVSDRTTWGIRVAGQPVHLLPGTIAP